MSKSVKPKPKANQDGETFTLYGPTDIVKKGNTTKKVKNPNVKINVPEATIVSPIDYLNSYYNSEEFKRKSGPSHASNIAYANNAANLYNIETDDGNINGSYAIPTRALLDRPDLYGVGKRPTITIDNKQALKGGLDVRNEIYPHEYSHTSRALNRDDELKFVNANKSGTVRDFFKHYENEGGPSKGKSFSEWYIPISSHEEVPSENYADLNALRWNLYKSGIYDARKGSMKKEHIEKAMQDPRLKDQFILKRLLKAFKPEDIVNLNNTVAANDIKGSDAAKNGKSLNSDPVPRDKVKVTKESSPEYVNDPSLQALSDILLWKNRNKNFVDRIVHPESNPSIQTNTISGLKDQNIPDHVRSTHLMAHDNDRFSGKGRVYPMLVQKSPGAELDYLNPVDAWSYSDKTGEYVETPSYELTEYFSKQGYKMASDNLYGTNYKQYMKYEDGGPSPKDPVKSFYERYIQSPKYKERLIKGGYPTPDLTVKDRLRNVSKAKVTYDTKESSQYQTEGDRINIDPTETVDGKIVPLETLKAHEYSHAAGAVANSDYAFPVSKTEAMNQRDINEIYSRNRLSAQSDQYLNSLPVRQMAKRLHDRKPSESKADLDTLRYHLYKDKIYDAGTQDFNLDHLNKARGKYRENPDIKRLYDYFSDDDILWMMNNIAHKQTGNADTTPTAKNGKYMKVKKKYLYYENLPCSDCKDDLMAVNGMYMDPGPRMPYLPGSLAEMYPPNELSMGADRGVRQIQGPVPIGTPPDTSKVKPGKAIDPKTLRPQAPKKGGGFNSGNVALAAMTAFDALLPNPVSKQQVVQPQQVYNPINYGLGSQAIMNNGGRMPSHGHQYDPWFMQYPIEPVPMVGQQQSQQWMYENGGYIQGEDENNSPSAKNGKQMKSKKKIKKYEEGGLAPAMFNFMDTFYGELGNATEGLFGAMTGGGGGALGALTGAMEHGGLVQAKDGNWIQKAVNPAHKGYCTPMTKSTCTPRRKALAKTFKKMAKNRKKDEGGFIPQGYDQYKGGGIIPDNMSVFNPHEYAQGGNVNGGAKVREVGANYPNTDLMEQWLLYKEGGNVNGGARVKDVGAMYPNTDLMEQWLLYKQGGNVNGGAKIREVGANYPNSDLMEQWLLYKNGGLLKAAFGTEIGMTGDPVPKPGVIPKDTSINWNSRNLKGNQIDRDALLSDRIGEILGNDYDPYTGQGRAVLGSLNTQYPDVVQDLGVRLKSIQSDPTYSKMTPEQRITRFYETGKTGTTNLDKFIQRSRSLGGNQARFWQGNATNQNRPIPTITFKNGGVMYDDGGEIETMWGGNANLESYNPYDGGMVEFNGQSHDQGGIGMAYNGNPVEVEGGELASKDAEGNLNIYGNMFIPGSKTKFKKAAKAIAGKEKRYDFLKTKGSDLVNGSNPANKFEQLKFNAGKVMMQGGEMGQADLASKKERLASLQKDMLDMASSHGLDPFEMSKGKMKKAKGGASIPFLENGGDGGNDPTRADRNMNPGNIKYGKFAKKYGAKRDKDGFAIFPNRQIGEKAMQDLLTSPAYRNMSAKDAIRKWTGGNPYRYDLGPITDKKISEMNPDELSIVMGTMTKGEGTRYGVGPRPAPKVPITPLGTPSFTPYSIPNLPLGNPEPFVDPVDPVPTYDRLDVPERKPIRSNVEPLNPNQLLGEMYGIATNKVEPVPAQRYEPQLYTPYQVSFQDRINANQAGFNAQMRAVGAGNPAALGSLAAQKYAADSAVYADEFRTNQAISNDITNKNIALVNDANLKNLGIADTQMVRQSQARSKTRELNQMILNSISSKYAQNEFENKRLAAYENLYDYRFVPQDDGGLSANYFGPNAMFNYSGKNTGNSNDVRRISRYDAQGNLKGYADYEDSQLKEQQRLLDIELKRRKLPLMPIQPLD